MSKSFHPSHKNNYSDRQGSVLMGILGSVAGMFVCIILLLFLWFFQMGKLSLTLQLFVGIVIGWFYRLFHGRRSKIAAYLIVGTCTALTCTFWIIFLVLLPVAVSSVPFTAKAWAILWDKGREVLLLCACLGFSGFFFTRNHLLAYADWKKAPWHIAYTNAGGACYNLLPEKLPSKTPPAYFAVHSRFMPKTYIIVEGSSLRLKRSIRKDRVFSVHDIAGAVLGPSNGCNVLYDKNYQVLAKFSGSMEHADLLLIWLFQWNIPIDNAPLNWYSPMEDTFEQKFVEFPVFPQFTQQFTLRLKRSTRIGFQWIGVFLLFLGAALFLAIDFSVLTTAERWAIILLEFALAGMGIVSLRIGKVCQVEIDGEKIRAVSRFGRSVEFSVREISSVSKCMGWIVFYDKEFKTLAKIESYLENLDKFKEYLASYGVRW